MFFKLFVLFCVSGTLICAVPGATGTYTSPKRGDHIINNSVLRLYKDIIDEFLQNHLKTDFNTVLKGFKKYPESTPIYKDYNSPIDNNIKKNIQTEMVVHFPNNYPYIDKNAESYGRSINTLRQSAVLHMKELYNSMMKNQRIEGTKYTQTIKNTIRNIISNQVYVDTMVKDYWLQHGGDKRKYEASFIAVQAMFMNLYDKLERWVQNIKLAQEKKKNYDF